MLEDASEIVDPPTVPAPKDTERRTDVAPDVATPDDEEEADT